MPAPDPMHPDEISCKIRYGTLDDVDLLAALGARTFHDTFAEHNREEDMQLYISQTFAPESIREELNTKSVTFLLALAGDTAVGYAKLNRKTSDSSGDLKLAIELERLYVTREVLGKGVGAVLMDACIAMAKAENFGTLWLGVWEHNPRAIAFYTRYGFTTFGQHPFKLGNDIQNDLLMKKEL